MLPLGTLFTLLAVQTSFSKLLTRSLFQVSGPIVSPPASSILLIMNSLRTVVRHVIMIWKDGSITEKMQKQVIAYKDSIGKRPFTEWLNNLRDSKGKQRILQRLYRLEQGNYGDYKSVGEGVNELRLDFGPGYRIYFGIDGEDIVLLLCGGDKGSQQDDIRKAKVYWKEYNGHAKLRDS